MHYHDLAINLQKDNEIESHLDDFFFVLAQSAFNRYAHIGHVLNSLHAEEHYTDELKCRMLDYEDDFDINADWRWRYYFFLDAINNLLK